MVQFSGRRSAMSAGIAVIGIIALGPAATADVNLTPGQAEQGGAADITFQVGNDRPGVHTTKVEVVFPEETPIAEIYPISVPGWAPTATSVDLDQPIEGIHSPGVTVATSAITWTRSDDGPKAPAVENLRVELGPLPQGDQLVLTVIQTYSDGKVRRWSGPPASGRGAGTVLRLVPAGGGAAAAHGAGEGDGHAVLVGSAEEQAATGSGTGLVVISAAVGAGVLAGALAVMVLAGRKNSPSLPATKSGPTFPPAQSTPEL